MNSSLFILFGTLIGVLTFMIVMGIWRAVRLREESAPVIHTHDLVVMEFLEDEEEGKRSFAPAWLQAWVHQSRFGNKLAVALSIAHWSLTPAEFVVMMAASGLIGGLLGFSLGRVLFMLVGGILGTILPYLVLRRGVKQRQREASMQVADLLQFLVGALKAGFGINQALESVVDQLPSPMREEIHYVLQSIHVGLSLPEALALMAQRIQSDEMDMLVVAITVQYEVGGNLTPTLENISQTIRDRIRIKREVQILTAQQRMSGYVLAFLPIALAAILYVINPDYIMRLFAPGWVRILPASALVMMGMGFLVIRKIVQIEV